MPLRRLMLVAILVSLSAASVGAPVEVPGAMSELMTRLQLQHAKLWFAGKLSNWSLATYELRQIETSLETASKMLPDPSRANRTREQLQAVGQALQSKDVAAFTKSYADLTNECNGCHRRSGYASIAIQIPVTSPAPNQLFVDQVAEGRALAHSICATCHVVTDAAKEPSTLRPPAPAFPEIVSRPAYSADALRLFLTSSHRRLGPDQTMPNPRLSEYQIEAIVAYLETLRVDPSR